MYRKCERGFSFVEFMMVATVLSFVTTGVKTFVFEKNPGPVRRMARQDTAEQGRASVEQMVRELELAGNPPRRGADRQSASGPFRLVSDPSHPGASPFLVAKPDQVIFEADLEGDGIVERVEYRLWNSAIWRRVVSADSDDADSSVEYEILIEYVDNGDLPLFQYGRDPFSGLEETAHIRTVWIALQLRPPDGLDQPQFRTLRFDGLAQHPAAENTVPIAGLQER